MKTKQSHSRSPETTGSWVLAHDHQPHISAELRKRYSALIDANGTHVVIALEMLVGTKFSLAAPKTFWTSTFGSRMAFPVLLSPT